MKKIIKSIADKIIEALKEGNKILICGNGGSAAEAQHFAGELICKYQKLRKPLKAMALTTDTSVLTAIANDFGYENVFARQIEAWGEEGDILITMTTSGSSANVLNAEVMAEKKKMVVIRLPNEGTVTPEIQENHLKFLHWICGHIEKAIEEKNL